MKYFTPKKGFTLVELVMVIVILGILAAVAVPKFANLTSKARQGVVNGQLGTVRSGITMQFAENEGDYPDSLDAIGSGTVATTGSEVFTAVVENGVKDPWWKKSTANSATPIQYEAHWTSGDANDGTSTVDATYKYYKTNGVFDL